MIIDLLEARGTQHYLDIGGFPNIRNLQVEALCKTSAGLSKLSAETLSRRYPETNQS